MPRKFPVVAVAALTILVLNACTDDGANTPGAVVPTATQPTPVSPTGTGVEPPPPGSHTSQNPEPQATQPPGPGSAQPTAPTPVQPTAPGSTVPVEPSPPVTGTVPSGTDVSPSPDPPATLTTITIEPPGATFEGQLDVQLSAEPAQAAIHYTTDGTAPTLDSPLYAGTPLTLTQSTQVRVQAFIDGAPSGFGAGGVYVARNFDVSSDMPVIVVDGYGAGKPDEKADGSWVDQDAAVLVFEPQDGNASLSHVPTVATRAGWHVRGQSSSSFEKTPYKVEFWNELNDDKKLPLLGMPEQSDWALVGPFYDRSMIRHAFIYDLGRDIGLQAPRFSFAEVYINHDGGPLAASHYEGIYMVVETIKNAKERLDLKQLREADTAEADISGGYIFKFDWAAASEPMLTCAGAPAVQHAFGQCPTEMSGMFPASTSTCPVEGDAGAPTGGGFGGAPPGGGFGGAPPGGGFGGAPPGGTGMPVDMTPPTCWADLEVTDPSPLNQVQKDWLTAYVTEFNDTLHSDPIGPYGDYIDVASFVDAFIINEFSKNGDAYVRSVYFHKDRDGKIVAGPLWDYNLTMAVGGSLFCNDNPTGWAYEFRSGSNDWFQRLIADPPFRQLVVERWKELRQGPLSQAALDERITKLTAPLVNAIPREYERWPLCSLTGQIFAIPEGDTFEAQLGVMSAFMSERGAWMDAQLQ